MGPHPCIIEAKGNMATLYTNEGPCSFIRMVFERMKEAVDRGSGGILCFLIYSINSIGVFTNVVDIHRSMSFSYTNWCIKGGNFH